VKKWLALTGFLAALLFNTVGGQEARVRNVAEISMPTQQVDSNSPAFWRDGRLFWFNSHGGPSLSEGADQFGPFEAREVAFQALGDMPHWIEAVWTDDDGTLWGWYHAEPIGLFDSPTLTAPHIGAVVSFDGGATIYDLGVVLETGYPLDPTAQNGYFGGGHGDCSVILDQERKYFYFLFDNYSGPDAEQGVVIARMAFEDRFNPVGKVYKYHNGAWRAPGIGGKVTPIFPVKVPWGASAPDALWGPSIHWNTYLQCYVMLMNHAQGQPGWAQAGVYVSFCYDLSRPEAWSEPLKLLDRAEFPGWYFFYPQVMGFGPGGTDTLAGQTARLYVGGISRWEIEFFRPGQLGERVIGPVPVPVGTMVR